MKKLSHSCSHTQLACVRQPDGLPSRRRRCRPQAILNANSAQNITTGISHCTALRSCAEFLHRRFQQPDHPPDFTHNCALGILTSLGHFSPYPASQPPSLVSHELCLVCDPEVCKRQTPVAAELAQMHDDVVCCNPSSGGHNTTPEPLFVPSIRHPHHNPGCPTHSFWRRAWVAYVEGDSSGLMCGFLARAECQPT